MRDTVFFRQAELLLKILPLIYREDMFALKGGTAINFFIRDLPRISVDIDLTYLPVNEGNSENQGNIITSSAISVGSSDRRERAREHINSAVRHLSSAL
jgi:predicted nucleotidyltransferase component of viral defense system